MRTSIFLLKGLSMAHIKYITKAVACLVFLSNIAPIAAASTLKDEVAKSKKEAKARETIGNSLWWGIPTGFIAGFATRFIAETKYKEAPELGKMAATAGVTIASGLGVESVMSQSDVNHEFKLFAVATGLAAVLGSFAASSLAARK
jgi:nucleoside recognition membrane protein YjiH